MDAVVPPSTPSSRRPPAPSAYRRSTPRPIPAHWPDTFPCTARFGADDLAFYESSMSSRILRAASLASDAWDAAVAEDCWGKISLLMFRLAVFGKVYELNQGESGRRRAWPPLDASTEETAYMMFFAYRLAGLQLHRHGQPVPRMVDVIPFCRASLDQCTTYRLDPDFSQRAKAVPEFSFELGMFDPLNIPEENYGYRCLEITYSCRPESGKFIEDKNGTSQYICDGRGNPRHSWSRGVAPSAPSNGRVAAAKSTEQPVRTSALNRSTGSTNTEFSEKAPGSLVSDRAHSAAGVAVSPRLLSPRTSLEARDDQAVIHSPSLDASDEQEDGHSPNKRDDAASQSKTPHRLSSDAE